MNERENTRDAENGRDPATIERDIDRTRASLGRTVDALERRLSPGELLDQALGIAREQGGEFATNLGRSVRNNPMPVILTGVGLAWMMASSNEPRAAPVRRYRAHETGWTDSHADSGESGSGIKERLQGGVDSARSAAGSISDKASHAKHAVGDSLSHLRESATGTGERMRMESQRMRQGFESLLEEQPLLVGAIGLAIGAALGAAFPRTEAEDRMLGEHSDSARRTMKDKAAGAYEDVKESAAEMVQSQSSKLSSSEEGAGTERLASAPQENSEDSAGTPTAGIAGSSPRESRDDEWHNTRGGI